MAYELIRFTLADPYLETLKDLSKGESIHIQAKQLLISVLGGESPEFSATAEEDLEEIKTRLHSLESEFSNIRKEIEDFALGLEMRDHGQQIFQEEIEKAIEILEDRMNQLNLHIEKQPIANDELITDAQLAEILKVNKSTITRWRSGKLKPSDPNFWENWKVEGTRWQHL
jgi:DNA-binding transcriptional regulator YiaG